MQDYCLKVAYTQSRQIARKISLSLFGIFSSNRLLGNPLKGRMVILSEANNLVF